MSDAVKVLLSRYNRGAICPMMAHNALRSAVTVIVLIDTVAVCESFTIRSTVIEDMA